MRKKLDLIRALISSMLLLSLCGTESLHAQNYSAIHGSNYSGALGVYNNPSSILTPPYKWDLTIFGAQFTNISNAIKGRNFPLYFSAENEIAGVSGNFKRYADVNANIHLLNGRFQLSKGKAIAFGVNVRTLTHIQTSRLDYNDSVKGARTFLALNQQNDPINIDAASSSWMEFYGSYAFTLLNTEASKLNVGATLKIMRGMSGFYANVENIGVESAQQDGQQVYNITRGSAKYGVSANHGDGSSFEVGDLFEGSLTSFAVDLGVEYLVKSQEVTAFYDAAADNDYEWKVGISLLDLGLNKYPRSDESRYVASLKNDISSGVISRKFDDIENLSDFNDSLATIVDESDVLAGPFYVINPARAVINADRYLTGNFYVNGELSVSLVPSGNENAVVRESKLITITPRWETSMFGFYMPVQYTRRGNFWVGAAVKAGPLLIGTHNLINAFSKSSKLGGGAYLALTIRPFNSSKFGASGNQQYDCPKY